MAPTVHGFLRSLALPLHINHIFREVWAVGPPERADQGQEIPSELFISVMLGIEPVTSHTPGKCSTTELHASLSLKCLRYGWRAASTPWSTSTIKRTELCPCWLESRPFHSVSHHSHGCLFSSIPRTRLNVYPLQAQLQMPFYLLLIKHLFTHHTHITSM